MGDSKTGKWRRGGRPPIGEKARQVYLAQIARGVGEEAAARAAGFTRSAFARLRRREAGFAALHEEAADRSRAPRFISRGKGRALQVRRNRIRFTDKRKEIFLDRFAGTCNLSEAAELAGIAEATVFRHLAQDPDFAARFREALGLCHVRLEADVLHRRIKGQQRLKEIEPTGEPEPEFDRAMKLLQRWDRKDGTLGRRSVGHGQARRWTFDEAIKLLAAKLKHMEGKPGLPSPEERNEGSDEDGDA